MASMRKMKGSWYARIVIYLGYYMLADKKKQQQKEILIPLHKSKTTAKRFMLTLEQYEDDIKSGNLPKNKWGVKLFWLDKGKSSSMRHRLMDVIPEYLENRYCDKRKSTADRDRVSLKQLTDFVGGNKAVEELSYKDIEGSKGLIQHLRNKPNKGKQGYSDCGINITLRHLKIFFNWLYKKEKLIKEPIEFSMIDEGKKPFYYFSESELKAIYEYDGIEPFYKRCFYFYEQSGLRASEPFLGELFDDWFIVPAEYRKNKIPLEVKLTDELKAILKEMHQFRDAINDRSKTPEKMRRSNPRKTESSIPPYPPFSSTYNRIAKGLAKVVKALGFKGKKLTLKSFRHTYGIKRVTITGRIHDVMTEMGHAKPDTTMKYLRIRPERRFSDFPSLAKHIERAENKAVLGDYGYHSMDTRAYLRATS